VRALSLLLLVLGPAAVGACAGEPAGPPALDVAAAASLGPALRAAAPSFAAARVRLATGGSDQLAARIRGGARPGVYAAASAALPRALHAEGLVERPVAFAANELVIAVPAGAARVRALADLGRPGVRIAAGSASVPVGAYADEVLARLPGASRRAVERNLATREPDVAGVLAKLRAGTVDAGFVYRTDVRGARRELRAIALPAALRPRVVYEAAVVRGGDPAPGRAYLRDLRSGAGAAALRRAGFLPPP
jgi:molybdate transport system substrate-binding protein